MCNLKIIYYAACGHTVNHNLERCEFDIAITFLSEQQIVALYPSWLLKYFYDKCMLSKDIAEFLANRVAVSCPDCKAARYRHLEAMGFDVRCATVLSAKDEMAIRDVERAKAKGARRQRWANWIRGFKAWRQRKAAEKAHAKFRKEAAKEKKRCRCDQDDQDVERGERKTVDAPSVDAHTVDNSDSSACSVSSFESWSWFVR